MSANAVRAAGRWLAVALLSGALFGPLGPTARAAGTSLKINPPTSVVKPGDSFRVDVVLSTDTPSRGLQLGLKYDPSLVQVDKVLNGTFYSSWATANGGQTANPVPFRPNNARGEVLPGAVIVLGGPPTDGATGSGTVMTLQMTAKPGVTGRSPLEFSTAAVSSAKAQTIPDVVGTSGFILVGVADDGAQPRTAPLIDANPPPPDVVSSGPGADTQGRPTSVPPVALVPTLNPAALAQAISQPIETAAPAAPTAPASPPTAPPAEVQPQATSVPQPTQPPPTAAPTAVPTSVSGAPVVEQVATAQPTVAETTTAPPPTSAAVQVNAPQVNLLATMSVLATAQAAPATPGAAAAPTAPAASALAARALPASSPAARPQAAAPIARPTSGPGVFIPWEVVAGVGGGLMSAALVLYAFRRPHADRP